jgi:hypothetical protein
MLCYERTLDHLKVLGETVITEQKRCKQLFQCIEPEIVPNDKISKFILMNVAFFVDIPTDEAVDFNLPLEEWEIEFGSYCLETLLSVMQIAHALITSIISRDGQTLLALGQQMKYSASIIETLLEHSKNKPREEVKQFWCDCKDAWYVDGLID